MKRHAGTKWGVRVNAERIWWWCHVTAEATGMAPTIRLTLMHVLPLLPLLAINLTEIISSCRCRIWMPHFNEHARGLKWDMTLNYCCSRISSSAALLVGFTAINNTWGTVTGHVMYKGIARMLQLLIETNFKCLFRCLFRVKNSVIHALNTELPPYWTLLLCLLLI